MSLQLETFAAAVGISVFYLVTTRRAGPLQYKNWLFLCWQCDWKRGTVTLPQLRLGVALALDTGLLGGRLLPGALSGRRTQAGTAESTHSGVHTLGRMALACSALAAESGQKEPRCRPGAAAGNSAHRCREIGCLLLVRADYNGPE